MELSDEGLRVRLDADVLTLRIDRPAASNAFTANLLRALRRALDLADADQRVRSVIIEGDERAFCTGLDLQQAAADSQERDDVTDGYSRIASCTRLVIAKVVGLAAAGGVGLAAACDIVVAGPRARFQLSELLWGLTPALVMPWLVRRVGLQKAHEMALTTRTVPAREAHRIHLVDVLVDDLDQALASICRRNARIPAEAMDATKRYMQRLCPMSLEMQALAREEHHRTFAQPEVRERLRAFLETGKIPWEAGRA